MVVMLIIFVQWKLVLQLCNVPTSCQTSFTYRHVNSGTNQIHPNWNRKLKPF